MDNSKELPRDDKLVQKKIDDEIKRFNTLKNSFTKIAESEQALSKNRALAFEQIQRIEESDNKYLKQIYDIYRSGMASIETLRKNMLSKMNEVIIPATAYYPEKIKEFRSNLGRISEIKRSQTKSYNEISKAKTKNDSEKIGKFSNDYQRAQEEEKKESVKLETDLLQFESERVDDNKLILLHHIHSELAFHATAIEKLAKLYQEINVYDPKENLPDFVRDYNLNTMKSVDLASKYGFTPGATERKKEAIANQYNSGLNVNSAAKYGMNSPNLKPSNVNSLINGDLGLNNAKMSSSTGLGYNPNLKTTGGLANLASNTSKGVCVSLTELSNEITFCKDYISEFICVPYYSSIWPDWKNSTIDSLIEKKVVGFLETELLKEISIFNSMPLIDNSGCLNSYVSLICKSNFPSCDPISNAS